MSIKRIRIEHFKSIDSAEMSLESVNLFIGENGTGKSNALEAVHYFFKSLLSDANDEGIFDINNKFSNEFSVAITFDFSHLQNISRNNVNRNSETDYADYYEWINRRGANETLCLRKKKDAPIKWDKNRQYRQNIANLFPLYYVDSRSIELTDWHRLWDIIGDLMKVYRVYENEISKEIYKIKDEDKYKLEDRYKKLSSALILAGVQLKEYTPKQYAAVLSTLMFKGSEFSFNGGHLRYMSNGTNAYNYTNLLIEILKLIAEYKVKDPIVILDEPEISLHHKLIDQLCERIIRSSEGIQFISATHSARFLKNMLRWDGQKCKIMHVSSVGNYSAISKMKHLSEDMDGRTSVVITDQHSNAYFSKYVLSVEGASESEVFSNRYLQELFPELKRIDIFEGMSDNVVQTIISPKQRHFNAKYLSVIDMDKVIRRNGSNTYEIVHTLLKPGASLQKRYHYSWVRDDECISKKRILGMASKCRFHYLYPFYGSNDAVFEEFIALIKHFFLASNIYVCSTTIEGVLINRDNSELFWKFFSHTLDDKALKATKMYYDSMGDIDRVNFLRLLVNGKSDMILSLKEIQEENKGIDAGLCRIIADNRKDKTSGWITAWIEYCMLYFTGISLNNKNPFGTFCAMMSNPQKQAKIRERFLNYFCELAEILNQIGPDVSL